MKLIIQKNKTKIILLGIALILCFSGLVGVFYEHTFKYFYTSTSGVYLENSIEKSTNIFLSLSAIKAFTAVIEGSELGINAVGQLSIQVGDIVQSLYDIIDIMWKVSFVGVVSLSIQKLFLEYFPSILLSKLIGFSILFYLPWLYSENNFTFVMTKVSKFLVILYTSIYFLIPINIYLASKTSEYLDGKYKQPAIEKLEKESENLSKITTELKNLQKTENTDQTSEESTAWYDIGGKISNTITSYSSGLENVFKNLKKIEEKLKVTTSAILKISITIITIYAVDAVIIPFTFLGLTYLFIQIVFLGNTNFIKRNRGKEKEKIEVEVTTSNK